MIIPHVEGITQDQWKAMDGYFNRVPKRFFYCMTLEHCIGKFRKINELRSVDQEEAEVREKRLFKVLGYFQ